MVVLEHNVFKICKKLIIPSNVTAFTANNFSEILLLEDLVLPEGLLTIGGNCFTEARCLSKIIIPSTVTSIGNGCFTNLYGAQEIHLLPTTPPTLGGTSAFSNTPVDCVFYVPQGSLNAYQTATNWSKFASKMQEELT